MKFIGSTNVYLIFLNLFFFNSFRSKNLQNYIKYLKYFILIYKDYSSRISEQY